MDTREEAQQNPVSVDQTHLESKENRSGEQRAQDEASNELPVTFVQIGGFC
jgi:hypothetical protein